MGKVKRVTIAISDDLLEALDRAMAMVGEGNRSRFISTLISSSINNYVEDITPLSLIVMVYNHELGDVERYITDVQHEYRDIIRTSTHIHINETDCAEVIYSMGNTSRIREMVNRIMRIGRGIKYMRIINIPIQTNA
jgi:CopG family nickel-responsive transcriptional regulator